MHNPFTLISHSSYLPTLFTLQGVLKELEAETGPKPDEATLKRAACKLASDRWVQIHASGAQMEQAEPAHQLLVQHTKCT